ncbi:Fizzy-related protein-like protein [Hypsibius exemplaris]|uniref:Fizzy-related protein-like protein n=1 Tax=Hypsibius exemplaris TaxID=2072580 RepID=A0A1W0X065_HYPEX|nr:Fizzy-related protein-like protein [Hypsibius exemplaris]
MERSTEHVDLENFIRSHSESCAVADALKISTTVTSAINSPDRYIPQRQPRRWRIAYTPYASRHIQDKSSTSDYENIPSSPPPSQITSFLNECSNDYEDRQANKALFQRLLDNEIMGRDMPDAMEDVHDQENSNRSTMSRTRSSGRLEATGGLTSASLDVSLGNSSFKSCSTIGTYYSTTSTTRSNQRNVFTYSAKKTFPRSSSSSVPLSLSPLSEKTHNMLGRFRNVLKEERKISNHPYRILDAPGLADDFYLSLIDWSKSNVIAVGLGPSVYLWSASQDLPRTRLCSLEDNGTQLVSSVSWSDNGARIAVGTGDGALHVWDTVTQKQVTILQHHKQRVGSLAWNGNVLASASRDHTIVLADLRIPPTYPIQTYRGHRQEVCGLKWSPDYTALASGGNDNRVNVWSYPASGPTTPMQSYLDHTAAVKAIAWSPHQHGLLATGGGTNDRYIRFWNTLTGQTVKAVNTGSQICNMVWSRFAPELLTTHGYTQHKLVLWKYPSMVPMAKMTGHDMRVLFCSTAPDGETVVTGAGDESLRFWHVFAQSRTGMQRRSSLDLLTAIR